VFCERPEIQLHSMFFNQVFRFVSPIFHSRLISAGATLHSRTGKRQLHTIFKRTVICNDFGNNIGNTQVRETSETELPMAMLSL
jgi:hypothetical protein